MTSFNEVAELIEPTLRDMGFELVQVRMVGGTRRTLQVMAEPIDRARRMTVDDCAEISHAISAVLDVADPIAGAYTLEVSSPGIDRPLVRRQDFVRFAGFEAKLETEEPVAGRKRFHGIVRGLDEGEDAVLVEQEKGELIKIPFASVKKAKLTLSEALLKSVVAGQD
ncbi:ribosome maturation factor RimP [Benzoatithermus flavus]|uniref:Ribosome maturation factor RimP n=1 Tax=Benzoatithermus flavus TaxID=3108223 RepID=A0ABU8XUQ4_9PROT